MKTGKTSKRRNTQAAIALMASLLSIAVGLLVGLLLLTILNAPFALSGFGKILTTGVASTEKLAKTLYQAMPMMLCGLSVAFAFKTGLFNIGAAGQYTMGAFCALTAAIALQQPWYIALIFAVIGGAVIGAVPGICKALFNVNEVITSIMFNWITMYAVNLTINNMPVMLTNYWAKSSIKDRTAPLADANPGALLPKGGLDTLMNSNYINIGIIIAILVAVLIWIILQKTVLGYELKACGYNRHASQYAGINAKRNIVLSMVISGALAGLGGGLYYLSGTGQYTLVKSLLGMGFNGIPVALLASSNPIGVIFSSLFISYIQVGGDALQPHFIKENIDIIISAIIYLSAFALLMKGWIAKAILRGSLANANTELAVSGSAELAVSDPDGPAEADADKKGEKRA
jgi:ABC-type uncharacterized transport system permease subunit